MACIGVTRMYCIICMIGAMQKVSLAEFLCDLKTAQSVSHLKLQVSLTQFPPPNLRTRQIHHTTTECVLVVPSGLPCTLHILQHTLNKMITEKVIKGPQIGVIDVIEFEDLSGNIIVARNERDDYMPALLE